MPQSDEKEIREKLLNNVKKEVKQLMELSATCKFIHENNHSFTNFCSTIDSCLLHGLKKDFLNKPSSYDLVKKISKDCKPAKEIVKIFNELESNLNNHQSDKNNKENKNSSSLFQKLFSTNNSKNSLNPETINHYVPLYLDNLNNLNTLWIKIAILKKCLNDIVDFLIKNSNKFYHPFALMNDSFDSAVFVALIAGPCAFDKYTRFKTIENAEPDADELIRRHKLNMTSPNRSPCRTVKSRLQMVNLNSLDNHQNANRFSVCNIKEFVESLHQNVTSQLIYGKNHVIVNQKEKSFAGYLSLHLNPNGLILNWTPNEILNGSYTDEDEILKPKNLNNINDLIIFIQLDTISYLHCHQQNTNVLQIIFVAQDGAQYPPIQFTDAPSLIHFLQSLQNGLKPIYKLCPNDWENVINSNKMPIIIKKVFASINSDLNELSTNLSPISPENYNSKPHVHLSPINNDNVFAASTPETLKQEKVEIKNLCDDIEYKILSRAFYGWLNYHKETKTVNKHLVKLLNHEPTKIEEKKNTIHHPIDEILETYVKNGQKIDEFIWNKIIQCENFDHDLFYKIIYLNGIQTNELRRQIWPFILGLYSFEMNQEQIELKNKLVNRNYEKLISEWKPYEEQVRINDEKKLNFSLSQGTPSKEDDSGICSDMTQTTLFSTSDFNSDNTPKKLETKRLFNKVKAKQMQTPSKFSFFNLSTNQNESRADLYNLRNEDKGTFLKAKNFLTKIIRQPSCENLLESKEVTSPRNSKILTIDEIYKELAQMLVSNAILKSKYELENELAINEQNSKAKFDLISPIKIETDKSNCGLSCVSPLSLDSCLSNNSLNEKSFDKELFDAFALNMHRIDKDVLRCDRNFWYFSSVDNLNKLRNIIYTYVWETIDVGYIQGMCDLIAPILVILDDEAMVYECFKKLMTKMSQNFVSNAEMDKNFSNMRSLVQILDHELFEHMNSRGDHTQFYFTYRWFLLDFKRELVYKDIFTVWETIWASKKYLKTDSFSLFIALALVETYRDIILENHMDFTDIIKFFNEMSEKHDVKETLDLARDLVNKLKNLIEEKYK
ncbi:unnamed protein product [Brachionus calyciflorus]|uniref:Uncharacterized protein n=1 Tax=Brachionus calyciflorus TaxID=104777 RepID=A0A813RRK8_9BILA|nr:unnamed protein product [Brachionus calyciflorus]